MTVHRSRVQLVQRQEGVSFEVAKCMLAAEFFHEQGLEIPDFGSVRIKFFGDTMFHVETPKTKAPAKKRATLRDAIKSAAQVAKIESEDDKTEVTNSDENIEPKKKSKIFKRKTKRPGRV